jgi:NAD(P)-dependent dehydrogenase (short-subunit alcohol dehydrogenase family)
VSSTVIVTGGTGGVGPVVTRRFLTAGWRVVLPYRTTASLDQIDRHDQLDVVRADLADPAGAAACVEAAVHDPDRPLAAVVNLVGRYSAGGLVHETAVDEVESLVRANLRPTYLVTQSAMPHLLAAGGGSVVCVSARAAIRPFPGAVGYVLAKAAVLAFVNVLDVEYAKRGIRANAVLPSVIDTAANRAADPDADPSRWVSSDQIAEVILFLTGDGATAIHGAQLPVYGRA